MYDEKQLKEALDQGLLWELHGKYYDLMPFIDEHPGGKRFLMQCRGSDVTTLFETTHTFQKIPYGHLKKYLVGENKDYKAPFDWEGDGFYPTLKRRVQQYFLDDAKKKNLSQTEARFAHHGSSSFLMRFVILYICFIGFSIGALVYGNAILATLWGLTVLAIGGYGHEALHGGVFKNHKMNRVLALFTFDLFSLSSFIYTAIHVPLHHVIPNEAEKDPDIEVHFPLVRLKPEHKHHFFHRFQHYYFMIIYLVALPFSSFADVVAAITGTWFGPYGKINKPYASELFLLLTFKVLAWGIWYVLPFVLLDFGTALLIVFLTMGLGGLIVNMTFGASHQVELAMQTQGKKSIYPRDWGSLQVENTVNFYNGGWFQDMMFAGLGYQIEHHLFPLISYSRLSEIVPIVKKTCEEFNLPYHYYPSIYSVYKAHFDYVKKMSRKPA